MMEITPAFTVPNHPFWRCRNMQCNLHTYLLTYLLT